MPTVIDSLIVELGLDPKKYDEGLKNSIAARLKLAEIEDRQQRERDRRQQQSLDAKRRAIEDNNRKIGNAFESTTNKVLAFGAAVIGAASLADFVKQTVTLDANIGRLANNLGVSTEALSAWEGAVRQVGGATGDADQSLQAIVSAREQIALTGNSPLIPYLRFLGL